MTCSQLLRSTTSKITALARSGRIDAARKLFDEMPQRDLITWNAMLSSYSQLGLAQDAMKLFKKIRAEGVKPDHYSFTAALSAIANAFQARQGRMIHGVVVQFGFHTRLPVCNSLIDMYGKCLNLDGASKVFEEMEWRNEISWCSMLYACVNGEEFDAARRVFNDMPNRVAVAWNILTSSYAQCGEVELCVNLFEQMRKGSCKPDLWTFAALMNMCAELEEPFCGQMIHACVAKSGWDSATEVNNSILSFYAKRSCVGDAVRIFESIDAPTQVTWNTMIDAHMRCGEVTEALLLFQQAPVKNVISWTTMIAGYARNGHEERALGVFVELMKKCVEPDDFTFGAAVHACSNFALLGHGRMVHGCAIHYGFHSYIYVGNGLVNMYAKCGDIGASYQSFNDIIRKDLISWNTMLFGFGLHGLALEAFRIYDEMLFSNRRPDKVTFIGLLMACSHSGLIERGKAIFQSMWSVHKVAPEADHIACMVDMLCRGGYLNQASKLVEKHSRASKTSSCEILLNACAVHGNFGLAEKICSDVIMEEPQKDVGYVMMSNMYCASGQWKEAEMVRKAMLEKGVKKMPGCSWIEVQNKLMVFVAGSCSNPCMEEICKLLNFLESEMKNPSFIGFFENHTSVCIAITMPKQRLNLQKRKLKKLASSPNEQKIIVVDHSYHLTYKLGNSLYSN
ncbi:hypothetical protein Sjap_006728 [Stephania japonica]|uniref:Pentatricopeptide repeat-containing protein n=1 Tax=Stephania japonica TaxID=461633 RepID=A0AAP0K7J1_9MAGN